jgi:D-xylose 1-dehydrogenase (NADP+, D-xylono-1,5-lactone-forming)
MTVRWGFIGAGNIATVALAPAVHKASNSILYAVASGDTARSEKLEPVKVHASYADLIDDPDVDAVYISLPNHLHGRWAIAALSAGKDVLCEKPLGLSHTDSLAMSDAAQTSGRLLVEATWTAWHPRFKRAYELVRAGDIGEITEIDSVFTFKGNLEKNYRLDPAMGGGSLLDVGLYQLHLWRGLSDGAFEVDLDSVAVKRSPSGVDMTTQVSGHINNSVHVSALSSFELPDQQKISITGSAGAIHFQGDQAFTSWREPSSLAIGSHVEEFAAVDAYQLMVENFADYVQGKGGLVLPIMHTLDVARVLDQIAQYEAITFKP